MATHVTHTLIQKEVTMTFSCNKKALELAAQLQMYVAEGAEKDPLADRMLGLAAELLVYGGSMSPEQAG